MVYHNDVAERIDYLAVKSKRECCFHIQYLKDESEDVEIYDLREDESIDECEKRINEELLRITADDHKKLMSLIADMIKAFQLTLLSADGFKWLNDSSRFCNWVWCLLRDNVARPRFSNRKTVNRSHGEQLFSSLSYSALQNNRNNVEDRRLDIIQAFCEGEAEPSEQMDCADYITKQWTRIYQNEELIDWLDKVDKAQWKWAWGYLEKKEPRAVRKVWIPVNEAEYREALVAAIDMFDDTYRKKLFLMNLKRAWSQKKFRDKPDGKKAYSINMTPKTKKRLDELADHYELKLNEVIEKLIKEEHLIVIK